MHILQIESLTVSKNIIILAKGELFIFATTNHTFRVIDPSKHFITFNDVRNENRVFELSAGYISFFNESFSYK